MELLRAGDVAVAAVGIKQSKAVNMACMEIMENPVVISMRQCCSLDKAVLACMYRYVTKVAVYDTVPQWVTTGFVH